MALNDNQVETLKKALEVAKVSESFVLKKIGVSELIDIPETRYLKCLGWLMGVARGEIWRPENAKTNS